MHGRRTLSKHGSDEAESQPQAKKKKIDLIFKDVLEASLEANQSRNNPLNSTLSFQRARKNVCQVFSQPDAECKESVFASGLDSMEHHESGFDMKCIKMEETEEEVTQTGEGPSTSFCPNCVRLKRRIHELEAELLRLRGQGHAEIKPLPPSEPLPSEDLRGRFAPGMERYHGWDPFSSRYWWFILKNVDNCVS